MAASGYTVVPVVFLKKFGAYNAGETAGFGRERADQLVTNGLARYVKKPLVSDRSDKEVEKKVVVEPDAEPETPKDDPVASRRGYYNKRRTAGK